MTPYSRGYAAALKAAARECEEQAAAFKVWEMEAAAQRCRQKILSLPVAGEATNPGEQVPNRRSTQADATDVARVSSGDSAATATEKAPARPGPSQECVMVPLLAWEYAITRLRGLHGLRLEGEPKPIDNAHFFKLLAAREE